MEKKGNAVIIVVAIIAVLAVLGGAFFFMRGNSPLSSLPGVTPRATEKDFEFITDPIMRKHFVAQANATAYRTKSNSSGRGTVDTMEIQMKGQDFLWRTTSNENGKDVSDAIYIGDTTYVKDFSDNKWWKQTQKPVATTDIQQTESTKPVDIKSEVEKEKDQLTFKSLGKEACGNLTCYKYEQSFGSGAGGTQTVWFDDQAYLSRKEEALFGEFKSTIEFSYDNVNVVAPSPTKDVPEGKSIFEMMVVAPTPAGGQAVPSQQDIQKMLQTTSPEENNP